MALVGVLAIVLAACSGEDGEAGTTTSTTAAPVATTTTRPPVTTTTPASTTTIATTTTAAGPVATATTAVVQEQLEALGYFEGVKDGVAGPVTVAALEAFQEDAEITVDGEFGPETAEALATAVEADTDFVKGIQEDLTEIGLYTGPTDGDYGSGTVAAVEKLQEQCEIEVDGRFTVKTHLCLIAELATA
jgi:peptidoglycan hydrolase-like protein with peptidoglycan-binding domain